MVHVSMTIPNYYLRGPFFSQGTHGMFKKVSIFTFRFDKLPKKWQIKREVQIGPLGTPYSQTFFECFKLPKFKSQNLRGLENFIIKSPIVTPFFHLPLCSWSYFNTN